MVFASKAKTTKVDLPPKKFLLYAVNSRILYIIRNTCTCTLYIVHIHIHVRYTLYIYIYMSEMSLKERKSSAALLLKVHFPFDVVLITTKLICFDV